ncbi:MAG: LacI family DNA-binding transcriptional regulator [Armatimonadetes bacterium]|nr:LacI family DNA-binding transcriptional regulator [Anaerolineae bacterium]
MRTPTIKDVAKHAGVGIGTVSRVLNNSPKVSVGTHQTVLAAIAALDFRPNTSARQLPRRIRLHNIGVITQPLIHYQAFAERLRGAQMALHALSGAYELVLYSVSSLAHFDAQLAAIAQTRMVDGLIIIDLAPVNEQKALLRDTNLPFVGINHFQAKDWLCIGVDNIEGGLLATRYLLDLGHTRIAYLGDELTDSFEFQTSAQRLAGYQHAMHERGIPVRPEYIRLGYHSYPVALQMAADLLALPEPPTAIFAMCDLQALACLEAARSAGLRVPADLSVMGFDDLEVSYHTGLTTIRQHFELSGHLAIEALLMQISGADSAVHALPPPEVVARHTTQRL